MIYKNLVGSDWLGSEAVSENKNPSNPDGLIGLFARGDGATVDQAGMVLVNLPTAGVDYHVPFGGRKGSSMGAREQGRFAVEFHTSIKTAYTYAG